MRILLGEKLRNLREEKNVTQIEVAKSLNCSAKMISNYELNKREPDLAILSQLCDYYNVTADYLLGRSENTMFYYQTALTQRAKELIKHFDQLPDKYQEDIIRITKLYTMADKLNES